MNDTPAPQSGTAQPRLCPHCGKAIPKLVRKPRDLGLLLNALIYRVPVDSEITEGWIQKAREHCRMKPERLAELRSEAHSRHWPRMLERRAARLAYFKQHGKLPPRWMPLLPGEPNRTAQLQGFYRYRKGGLAKLKARMRKRPDAASVKLHNRHLATRRIRSESRRMQALDACLAQLVANLEARNGKLTLAEYEALKPFMQEKTGSSPIGP